MREIVLITGANGEVGHGLIHALKDQADIIALDVSDLDPKLISSVKQFYKLDITDLQALDKIFSTHKINLIFHLAAILSTTGEKNPELAHKVNVGGTFNLLSLSQKYGSQDKRTIKFIFPSTIAVYGMGDIDTKNEVGKVFEEEFNSPITMYGISKLYCENLGIYFSTNYQQLTTNNFLPIDFRCVRFPGLISADTMPTGGTSDYAPEMIHAAAQRKPYDCFVRPDAQIPFMAMPDGVRALIDLAKINKKKLTTSVYNISGFSVSADEIEKEVKKAFPNSVINYEVTKPRQKIVDSWPKDIDDSRAKKDWGWKAEFNFKKTFNEYLVPKIKEKYN